LDRDGLALRDVAPPVPGPGEALIRVAMAGICNTDLELRRGYMGFSGVLGHELCGVVEACASDAGLVGRRVAGEINLACGHCELCACGLGRHCPKRTVLGILGKDGCFAEYVTLPRANLHALPDSIADEIACFVEPTAAACQVLEQVDVSARTRVAVLGDGKLGLLIAQVLAARAGSLTLAGKHARKLELARGLGIATSALAELPRKAFDIVVEATGSKEGMAQAIELVRPRGTIVLKSTYHGGVELDLAPVVIDELCVVGSRCGPFPQAIAALEREIVRPRALLDAVLGLADAEAAFERAAQPGTLKVLLDMRS
jgi:threonine dehydrogenase-like Zn-dependent dehydrogenase